ncbi:uncharacterized protein LOC136033883 isoform X2 [Artemia franciscana]
MTSPLPSPKKIEDNDESDNKLEMANLVCLELSTEERAVFPSIAEPNIESTENAQPNGKGGSPLHDSSNDSPQAPKEKVDLPCFGGEKRKPLDDTDISQETKKAKLETRALKAKRPGFSDERYNETDYYFENGKS